MESESFCIVEKWKWGLWYCWKVNVFKLWILTSFEKKRNIFTIMEMKSFTLAGYEQGIPLACNLVVQGWRTPVLTRSPRYHHIKEVRVWFTLFHEITHTFGSSTNFRVFTHLLIGNGQVWWWAPLVLLMGGSTGRNIQEIVARFPFQNVHKIMEFHSLFLHPPRYLMILKYLTIFHPNISNHRCQATNLAGSSEQTTPVTVRHAGESNVQWPKCDVNLKVQCSIAVLCVLMVHCFTTLIRPASVFQNIFFAQKLEGLVLCLNPYDCFETIALPSWFLFYSNSVPRGRPLSNRQLLSERGQLRLLQVHRRVGLQVIRRNLIQSLLVISCVGPKHKQIL